MIITNKSWTAKVDSPYVLIVEKLNNAVVQPVDNQQYIFTATVATFTDEKNENGRKYIREDYLRNLPYLQERCLAGLTGELDHPEYFEEKYTSASHIISDVWYDQSDDTVKIKFKIVDTPAGLVVRRLIDSGVKISVSSRSAGKVDANGVVTLFRIFTYDIVAVPGFKNAMATRVTESKTFMENYSTIADILDKNKDKSILNKLELVSENVTDYSTSSIYAINESIHTNYFRNIEESINKKNNEEEMANQQRIAQLEAELAQMKKVFEANGFGAQDTQVQDEDAQKAQKAQDAKEGAQPTVQPAQPAQNTQVEAEIQPVQATEIQPEVKGGVQVGVGFSEPVQGSAPAQPAVQIPAIAQPVAPISIPEPVSAVPPIPAPPVATNVEQTDLMPLVMQLTDTIKMMNTMMAKVAAIESTVNANAEGLNQVAAYNEAANARQVMAISKIIGELNIINESYNVMANWVEGVRESAVFAVDGVQKLAAYQTTVSEGINKLVGNNAILEQRTLATEGYLTTVVHEKINEAVSNISQISEMINSGNIITGKATGIANRNLGDIAAGLLESAKSIEAELKDETNYKVLENTHPFLKFATPADKELFFGLDLSTKNEVAQTLKHQTWTSAKDIHTIITGIVESKNNPVGDLPFHIKYMPEDYKEVYAQLNENEKYMIEVAARNTTITNLPQVNAFWNGLKLETKIQINESYKAKQNLIQESATSIKAYQKMMEDRARGYSLEDIDRYALEAKLKNGLI